MKQFSTLDKLAAFLPYGVEVRVDWEDDPQRLNGALYQYLDDWHRIRNPLNAKPFLRPFSHLTREMLLPNGSRGIPAVEVAKMALGLQTYNPEAFKVDSSDFKVEVKYGTFQIWDYEVNIDENFDVLSYYSDTDGERWEMRHTENQAAIFDFLRACHFCIGFNEGEYLPKED